MSDPRPQESPQPIPTSPDAPQMDPQASAPQALAPQPLGESIDLDKSTLSEATNALLRMFNYSASLPERTLRSASAIAGGLVRESANWLVPSAFRNSKSYSIFVQQMLDFVVSDIGGVRKSLTANNDRHQQEVALARKTVGNLLDMSALATFHVSPLTVLAVFSDLAYGSKVYLEQLSNRLKEQGIIDQQTSIDSAADLIESIQAASGKAAGMFDQPPISIQGLRKTIEDTRSAILEIDPSKLLPRAEIDQLWRQMELAAKEQNASLWDVSATISIVALNNIQAAGQGTIVGLEIAGDMFTQHIVRHYWEGLRAIERDGLIPTLSKASEPYLEAVWSNFTIDRKTWTEQLLSGELLKWGWSQLSWPKVVKGGT
jgi:hypothetical protein